MQPQGPTTPQPPTQPSPAPEPAAAPAPNAPGQPAGAVPTVPGDNNVVPPPPTSPAAAASPQAEAPKNKSTKGVAIAAVAGGVFILALLLVAVFVA